VPVLGIAGWHDDARGTIRNYTVMSRLPNAPVHHVVMDAGAHKGIDYVNGDFGPQARIDHRALQLRWFDHWDADALSQSVADAFPGSSVDVTNTAGWFEVQMNQHGLLRPLKAAELSDGTLRYLLWVVALLTPRPPGLLVLNEPETSLHPDLLPALGRLIAAASARSQVIVVSHAAGLIDALQSGPDCHSILLGKTLGETTLATTDETVRAPWQWPAR
jgi:predicted ATPase